MDDIAFGLYEIISGTLKVEYSREQEVLLALLYPNLITKYPAWGDTSRIRTELDKSAGKNGLLSELFYFMGFYSFSTQPKVSLTGTGQTNIITSSLDSEADEDSIISEEYWLPALEMIRETGMLLEVTYVKFDDSTYSYNNDSRGKFQYSYPIAPGVWVAQPEDNIFTIGSI